MKSRFSSLDVHIIANELAENLINLRIVNIYDISSRKFLFKFQLPNKRAQLLVNTGFYCHLTNLAHPTYDVPSSFVSRLRKFLKTRRVTHITQVGTDRILQLTLSNGLYHLFLEFYAAGNIVLTDADLTVIGIFRNVVIAAADHEKLHVGSTYNLTLRQNYAGIPQLTLQRVTEALLMATKHDPGQISDKIRTPRSPHLREALSKAMPEFPPDLLITSLYCANLDKSLLPESVLADPLLTQQVFNCLTDIVQTYFKADSTLPTAPRGFIYAKSNPSGSCFVEFSPFRRPDVAAKPDINQLEFATFNEAVDRYFSSAEGQIIESRLQSKKDAAQKKLESARQSHRMQISGLQHAQQLNVTKANAIEQNVELVEAAMQSVGSLVAEGMDWLKIEKLISHEEQLDNPIARIIVLPLRLNENIIRLKLPVSIYDRGSGGEANDDVESECDSSELQDSSRICSVEVDIDLTLSVWANARQYYDQKKLAQAKETRTAKATNTALKRQEAKILQDLEANLKREQSLLQPLRQAHWFEKFHYFFTSDGFLVIGGKDAQQCDLLFLRYLNSDDIFVYTDVDEATPLIVKNFPKSDRGSPLDGISPTALAQAGAYCLCLSKAWASKAVTSAWWIKPGKVSKMSSSGDLLAPGLYSINGEKNYLPPTQLSLGFAIVFEISPSSLVNHPRGLSLNFNDNRDGDSLEIDSTKLKKPNHEICETESSDEEFPDVRLEMNSQLTTSIDAGADSDSNSSMNSESKITMENGHEVEKEIEREGEPGMDNDTAPVSVSNCKTDLVMQDVTVKFDNVNIGKTMSEKKEPSQATCRVQHRGRRNKIKRGRRRRYDDSEEIKSEGEDRCKNEDCEDDNERTKRKGGTKAPKLSASQIKQQRIHEQEMIKQEQERQRLKRQQEQRKKVTEQVLAVEANLKKSTQEMKDVNLREDEQENTMELVNIRCFVPRIHPHDDVIAAIPICAPWSSLSQYKYKLKLTPGSSKKGKIVRSILQFWTNETKLTKRIDTTSCDPEKWWPSEIEALKKWRECDLPGILPVGKLSLTIKNSTGINGKFSKPNQKSTKLPAPRRQKFPK